MGKQRKRNNSIAQTFLFVMILAMLLQLATLRISAAEASQANDFVTRLEWLKALTETFGFTVEEENYPDNYYSDVDSDSADYYEIMLATEFGLIDVEAGEALRPDDAATREFAAHTLNLCLGYILEEDTYTFSEAETATYPEDIQIAVNRGWFSLSNGNFLPKQAVTQAEKENMIAAAKETLAQSGDHSENNVFTFKEGVIVLPEDTVLHTSDEDTFLIEDCPAVIKAGDIFGIVCDGMPLAWKAVSVEVNGNQTVITTDMVSSEEAFDEIHVSGTRKIDLVKLEPASEDVSFRYIAGGTKEHNYEDGLVCETLEEAGEREITAVLVEQTADLPKSRASFNVGDAKIKLTAKVMDVTEKHGIQNGDVYIDFSFQVDFNCNVSVDFLEAAGISPSYELFRVDIAPGIYVKGLVDLSFYGEANIRLVEHVDLGFHYDNFVPRLVRGFRKDSFTITAKAQLSAGMRLEAGFKIPGLSGKIFGKLGSNITAKAVRYTDGQKPDACQTISAYLYASVGYDVSVDAFGHKKSLAAANKDIYTRYNSPVRVAYHFEGGVTVPKCTRGTPGMGYGGWGYFSPIHSQYYYAGGSSGGTYENGEVYTIFDYTLNADNQATITGYRGTAVNVFIPETLDGYPVVGIGQNTFRPLINIF